jgi:hypothetical protein
LIDLFRLLAFSEGIGVAVADIFKGWFGDLCLRMHNNLMVINLGDLSTVD